jgi:hypothetical protein
MMNPNTSATNGAKFYGHERFLNLVAEEVALHSQKNADYTSGGDPLGNFKRVAAMLDAWNVDLPPELVAFVYMLKQVDAVGNMLGQDYEGQTEDLKARLMDISVYAKLAIILHEEAKDAQEA